MPQWSDFYFFKLFDIYSIYQIKPVLKLPYKAPSAHYNTGDIIINIPPPTGQPYPTPFQYSPVDW